MGLKVKLPVKTALQSGNGFIYSFLIAGPAQDRLRLESTYVAIVQLANWHCITTHTPCHTREPSKKRISWSMMSWDQTLCCPSTSSMVSSSIQTSPTFGWQSQKCSRARSVYFSTRWKMMDFDGHFHVGHVGTALELPLTSFAEVALDVFVSAEFDHGGEPQFLQVTVGVVVIFMPMSHPFTPV